jgi:uncharacterized protein YbaP (TraB family)
MPTAASTSTARIRWRRWGWLLVVSIACAAHASLHAADAASAPGAPSTCPPVAQTPTADQIQAAQSDARDRGFLWRVTKQGRSSYLFGTLHLGKMPWIFHGPRLREALAQTDTLALELDLTDPAVLKGAPSAAAAPMPLSDALRTRLSRQITAACLPAAALQQLNPLMQAITLTVLSARWEGLDPRFGQEIVLATTARVQQRPIVALESVQSQLAVLLPTDAAEAERLLDQTLEQLEKGRARVLMRRLAEAWADGRFGEIENYAKWCECADTPQDRAFLVRLNDERNGPMAERIDALHSEGKRVLVAVGALHMTGEQGLPRLMAARGYTVERLVPP